MRFGNLEDAVGAYQQGTQWAQQQQQQRQQQAALLARGLSLLAQMNGQPQGQPADPGMTPAQSAQAVQTAQGAAQTAGWPQAGPGGAAPPTSPASPVANPAAVLKDPQMLARLGAMAQGGPQAPQGPQMPVPGAPSMAQPRPAQQPPMRGLSSTAQPDAAGMDDPIKAAQQSIQTIASGIKAANPNIDPRTLALAVDQQIEQIKGVSPLTKAAMTAQMATVKLQMQQQIAREKFDIEWANAGTAAKRQTALENYQINLLGERHYEADERSQTAVTTTGMRDQTSRANTQDRDATQVTTTGMRDQTSRDNNADTQAGEDRRAAARNATTRAASADAAARSAYAANMKVTRNPAKAKAAAASARAEWKRANSSTPDYEGMGGKKAPDGHWYKPNTGPDKATHPYIQLDA